MKIEGKVETIIFKNNQNSWSVLLIKSQKEYITAVGQTDEIEVGDDIEHKVYGEQLKFTTYKKILPRTSSALIDYIADNIKGIGKKTASKIVTEFGKSTIDTIRFQKEKLSNIKGLNREKIDNLSEFFNNEYDKWNTIDYLNKLGISIIIASKIYKSLGQETINIINENPYSLIGYVKTLDFTNIDDIGKKLGVSLYNEERIDSGIIYALGKATEFGHTCIEIDILVKYAIKILEVEEDIIRNGITRLMLNDIIKIEVIEDVEYVFKKNFYLAEKNIAKNVVLRSKIINNKDYIKDIDKTSRKNNIELSEEQKKAINTCLNNSISIITGGPGTGKITIIKFIIDIIFQYLQYKHIEYKFYENIMIYEDDFLNQHRKTIEYKNIKEIEIRRTIWDRLFNYGVIIIHTNAENFSRNGIIIYGLNNPKYHYDIIYNIIHSNNSTNNII